MIGENDSGPAFPQTINRINNESGMSLRDWFAGMALQGLLIRYGNYDNAATEAFYHADLMLAERKSK